jgi:hypothetical protein
MVYESTIDCLTDEGLRLSSRISSIADAWGLTMAQALANIRARASIRETMVRTSLEQDRPELLEPEWVVESNNAFWSLVEDMQGSGDRDFANLAEAWETWWEEVTRDG